MAAGLEAEDLRADCYAHQNVMDRYLDVLLEFSQHLLCELRCSPLSTLYPHLY